MKHRSNSPVEFRSIKLCQSAITSFVGRVTGSTIRLLLLFFFCLACLWPAQIHASTLPTNFVEQTIGGTWNEAVGVTFAPDGRMFVWERAGRVWIVENGTNKLAQPLIDIKDEVAGYRDFGLLGFALDPNFYTNGYIYLLYVVDHYHLVNSGLPGYNSSSDDYYRATIGRITRYTANAGDGFHTVNTNSRLILVGGSISNGFPILHESHGVGSLVFGTDGTLLASCGDGASYNAVDVGSDPGTYYAQGLAEGVIKTKENVGAYRSQLVDCLNGKVIRIDPATGDGIPGNPFYDVSNPRSARSRVWALGLRNPCRFTVRPDTGSTNRADANPGVLYLGDVGWQTWEELSVATGPGKNFGWPAFEGLEVRSDYYNSNTSNQDAPNPLYGSGGCTQQYFYFRGLIIQDTLNPNPFFTNSCNTSQQVPTNLYRFIHTRPVIDWKHTTGPSRTGIYSNNNAAVINIGAPGSPVSGPQFAGNCSIGGVWYTGNDFPAQYQNTYFSGDYGAQWIRNFSFDQTNKPVSVRNFLDGGGGIVAVATHPINGGIYYISWTSTLKKISYWVASNQPPTAVATADKIYGPGPLTVQFIGTNSTDPETLGLTYKWNFGDGSPTNNQANPAHTFTAPTGVPTAYNVSLTVTDSGGLTSTTTLLVSVNNTPPVVNITSPVDGSVYPLTGNTLYNLTASVADAEHPLNQLSYRWQTTLHHNNHVHTEPYDTNALTTTIISPAGCDGQTYFYSITLTVTEPAGLSTAAATRLYPDCPDLAPLANGLQGVYFDNINLTNLKLTRTDPTIDFDWGSGSPDPSIGANTFSARWTGQVKPQFTETYTFYTVSDDGIRLWINDDPVIDSWVDKSPTENSGTIALVGGLKANIKIEYYENGGGAVARLLWSSPSTPKAVVPQSRLYSPSAASSNSLPSISVLANQTTTKNAATPAIPFTLGDATVAASNLTLSASASNPPLVPGTNIVFGGSDSNRTVTILPAFNQTGNTTITVSVSNGVATASRTFLLTVLPTNTPPALAAISNQTIVEGTTLSFTNVLSDSDLPANGLTLSLGAGAPTGAAITNGVFSWTPDEEQGPGMNVIQVIVSDDGVPSLSATQSFTVLVLESNRPPVLAAISNRTVHANSFLTITAMATDTDIPADLLTFSLDPGAPATASINPTNGVFTWTPTDESAGSTNPVTVRVTDNGTPNLSDTKTFTIAVISRPVIQSITVDGGTVTLTWNAIAGTTYRVEYKANLDETVWSVLPGDVTAAEDTANMIDNISTNAQRYYRITLAP